MVGIYKFNDRIEISGTWVYGTGNAFSIPVAKYEGYYWGDIYHYDGRNSARMRDYHRLDIGASFSKVKKKAGKERGAWVFTMFTTAKTHFSFSSAPTTKRAKMFTNR